jgi:hypothetical protein
MGHPPRHKPAPPRSAPGPAALAYTRPRPTPTRNPASLARRTPHHPSRAVNPATTHTPSSGTVRAPRNHREPQTQKSDFRPTARKESKSSNENTATGTNQLAKAQRLLTCYAHVEHRLFRLAYDNQLGASAQRSDPPCSHSAITCLSYVITEISAMDFDKFVDK